jgi:serine/threonine protein kinase/tetratricopeptide (TPR) repeat protein
VEGGNHPTGRRPTADWQTVDRLFNAALDLPESERAAFLTLQCGDDSALGSAVERLLGAERRSAAMFAAIGEERDALMREALDEPASGGAAAARIGEHLGPWRLTALLGEGGMAWVYLAERADGRWEQHVAVKLLRAAALATDSRRLVTERQILSTLDHPNIARLIDGGTTSDGQPYLVTEYVRGQPITTYCTTHRLGVEQRLELFVQVATAVHHAHQKLVVHRDLKPSNILVDEEGNVRLLDFGIAKLLEPEELPGPVAHTRTGLRPMTPEYAAPEQIVGGSITTVTDVYQLGLLLHELLTGERPKRTPLGTASTDAGGSVPRPSTQVRRTGATDAGGAALDARRLSRRLRGDLDIILQTSLRDDPARRYASAAAMGADVRAHLAGRAVSARPESPWYLLGRFARRSPVAAATAVLLFVAITGWAATLQLYSTRLAEQRDTAAREADRATRTKSLLVDLFRQTDPLQPEAIGGQDVTVWESLDSATTRMRNTLAAEPELLAELLATVGSLQERAGRFESARDLLLQVVALEQSRGGPPSARLVAALGDLGAIERQLSNAGAARAHVNEAMRLMEALPPAAAATVTATVLSAAHLERYIGSQQAAEALYIRALSRLDAPGADDPATRIDALEGLGATLRLLGRFTEAEQRLRQALTLAEAEYGNQHSRLVPVLTSLGITLQGQDPPRPSAELHRRALDITREHRGDDHTITLALRNNLAIALGVAGDREGEQQQLRELLEARLRLQGKDHALVGVAYQNLAASLAKTAQFEEALTLLERARETFAAALPGSHVRAFPWLTEALIHLQRQDPASAARAAEAAHDVLSAALPAGHYATGAAQCLLGEARLAEGKREAAAALIAAGVVTLAARPPDDAYRLRCEAAQTRL